VARCDIVIRSRQIHNADGPGTHSMGVGLVKISFRHVINCFETFIHVVYWCARDSAAVREKKRKASDDIDVSCLQLWRLWRVQGVSKTAVYINIRRRLQSTAFHSILFAVNHMMEWNFILYDLSVGWAHNQSSNMWNQPCPRTLIPHYVSAQPPAINNSKGPCL